MIYYIVEKKDDQLYLIENMLDKRYTLKTETNFSQCNGYLGVRASFETKMLHESRGMFVAGFYHKAGQHEVTELINCPDLIEMDLRINDEDFYLDTCKINGFTRKLNVMTGELDTYVDFDLTKTKNIKLRSRRFVSLKDRHLICHQLEITVAKEAMIQIVTGINGQITNSGVSHFDKVENRVFDQKYMYTKNRCDDEQLFEAMTVCGAQEALQNSSFQLKRRSVLGDYQYNLDAGKKLVFTKYSYIDTGTINDHSKIEAMQQSLINCEQMGYDNLLKEQIQSFDKLWKYAKINIKGATLEEEASIAFAQYHLFGMTPSDTSDCSVAAKGLTGEGYKGHVFWDTELFVMPFFTAVFPNIAKNLLKYRYKGLSGAREKALNAGYEGAMYPWEAAKDGREETPLYAALNIHSGVAEKVWSGIKEHHVTADIIYALWDYYKLTNDKEFLQAFGYEMLIETANFWCTRAKLSDVTKLYEILDIIGPDEYTEHVDNNAYTNYLAAENVKLAYEAMSALKVASPEVYHLFTEKYKLEDNIVTWKTFLEHIYLPKVNKDGIIPQDDTFLSKKKISDIERYRESNLKQSILKDYSREEVVNMQILKQADVVMLLNLMPGLFSEEVVKKNVKYYENITIHDSSLSYSAHAIACANIGDMELACDFFTKAMEIDLDTNYLDSNDGIHTASLGGIWNCVIQGFAGVKYSMGYVEIKPHLPNTWEEMQFYLMIKGQYVKIMITNKKIVLETDQHLNNTKEKLQFLINGEFHQLEEKLEIKR